jgi:hypothetical protein
MKQEARTSKIATQIKIFFPVAMQKKEEDTEEHGKYALTAKSIMKGSRNHLLLRGRRLRARIFHWKGLLLARRKFNTRFLYGFFLMTF